MGPLREIHPELIVERLRSLDGLARLRSASAGTPTYLVGGAVRDLLLGATVTDLDVVVEGEIEALAAALGGNATAHERFGTATVDVDGLRFNLGRARTESYPRPGALPEVLPASLAEDLSRRDFTINAIAAPLTGEPLVDPHGGIEDLRDGLLRVLHPGSFSDDPTRALRAARYAARLELELEAETAKLLSVADLGSVSRDRVEAELRRVAAERAAPEALERCRMWGLLDVDDWAIELARAVATHAGSEPWSELADRAAAVLIAAGLEPGHMTAEGGAGGGRLEQARRVADRRPDSPSGAVLAARGCTGEELLVARALGAEWLDDYARRWRHVALEIDGSDLLAAGVPEGPGVGAGLDAALAAKLDGRVDGREQELRLAIEDAAGYSSAPD